MADNIIDPETQPPPPRKWKAIAFTGAARSGKSTCVDIVEAMLRSNGHTVTRRAFADPLKAGMQSIFGFTKEQMYDPVLKEQVDPRWGVTPRLVLQKVGTEWFRNGLQALMPGITLEGRTIWIKRMEDEIDQLCYDEHPAPERLPIKPRRRGQGRRHAPDHQPQHHVVLIEDVRFDDEAEMLRKRDGAVIVGITRPGTEGGGDGQPAHASEAEINGELIDLHINNDATIDDLYVALYLMLRKNGLIEDVFERMCGLGLEAANRGDDV